MNESKSTAITLAILNLHKNKMFIDALAYKTVNNRISVPFGECPIVLACYILNLKNLHDKEIIKNLNMIQDGSKTICPFCNTLIKNSIKERN